MEFLELVSTSLTINIRTYPDEFIFAGHTGCRNSRCLSHMHALRALTARRSSILLAMSARDSYPAEMIHVKICVLRKVAIFNFIQTTHIWCSSRSLVCSAASTIATFHRRTLWQSWNAFCRPSCEFYENYSLRVHFVIFLPSCLFFFARYLASIRCIILGQISIFRGKVLQFCWISSLTKTHSQFTKKHRKKGKIGQIIDKNF